MNSGNKNDSITEQISVNGSLVRWVLLVDQELPDHLSVVLSTVPENVFHEQQDSNVLDMEMDDFFLQILQPFLVENYGVRLFIFCIFR